MRFVYVGNYNQPHSTEKYIASALESLGHEVDRVQENLLSPAGMLEYLRSCQYSSVLLFSKCELLGLPFNTVKADPKPLEEFLCDVRRLPGIRAVVSWVFDLMRPEFSVERYKWACAVASQCDVFFCTDSGLRLIGPGRWENVVTLRQGHHDPERVVTGTRGSYQRDVVFLGSVWGERRRWHRMLLDNFHHSYAKFEEGVYNDDLHRLCRSARVVAGPLTPFYEGYWSNRIYVVAGCGGVLACPEVDGMEEEGWQPYVHYLPLYGAHLPGKSMAQLKDYVSLPDAQLREIGDAAQRLVIERFTYRHRCADLVREVERRLG